MMPSSSSRIVTYRYWCVSNTGIMVQDMIYTVVQDLDKKTETVTCVIDMLRNAPVFDFPRLGTEEYLGEFERWTEFVNQDSDGTEGAETL